MELRHHTTRFSNALYKDWIAMGFKFKSSTDRKCMQISPYFLFTLDAIYQILEANPGRFGYNSRFLETLAYHSTSRRFQSFLFDNDRERLENSVLDLEDGEQSSVKAFVT